MEGVTVIGRAKTFLEKPIPMYNSVNVGVRFYEKNFLLSIGTVDHDEPVRL